MAVCQKGTVPIGVGDHCDQTTQMPMQNESIIQNESKSSLNSCRLFIVEMYILSAGSDHRKWTRGLLRENQAKQERLFAFVMGSMRTNFGLLKLLLHDSGAGTNQTDRKSRQI